ncbi:uncharacterized protein LOC105699535 isoform X2 [Orussus abietinus]|uniref:uncharacterized protein LOC105699535 isoform X2 n=1 Tax=Orussus abietinus TaxID=222816 RepID=UPI000625ADEA|nr:uncharacterized protein LOC105699535 isoform X2 [Orussus abietinus]
MYAACKCLNVSIRSRSTELQRIDVEDMELTPMERANPFFSESIATIPELEGITKEQSGLVDVKNVGAWVIHRCYNCSLYTHAVHREYGAAMVLINTSIVMSSEEINKLKANPDYSPVFRIVIDRSTLDDVDLLQTPTRFSATQLPVALQMALGSLQQQLDEAVQRQAADAEEKIRAFTAQQYQLLEEFRDRAHMEHRFLARLICTHDENKPAEVREAPPASQDSFKANINDISTVNNSVNAKPRVAIGDTKVVTDVTVRQQATAKRQSNFQVNGVIDKKESLKLQPKEPSSFDAEAMFTLEGMDDPLPSDRPAPWDEESDTDGHDEGIHIPRGQRGGHPTLAKSLPVSVPVFPSFVRRNMQDQDDDQLSRDPLDPHNIRASIKALAKSVHGDTVFGDLPRPRFSTQI